jgi:ABC-type phosphate transport system substrate-binding protein
MPRSPLIAWFLLALVSVTSAAQTGGYVVIVNASNPAPVVSKPDLARLFLRQTRQWPDGTAVAPVDQSSASATRQSFTKEILGMSTSAMRDFWFKQTFSGANVPPPVKESDAAVIVFVGSQPGAIGYVSASTVLPGVVKAVKVNP